MIVYDNDSIISTAGVGACLGADTPAAMQPSTADEACPVSVCPMSAIVHGHGPWSHAWPWSMVDELAV